MDDLNLSQTLNLNHRMRLQPPVAAEAGLGGTYFFMDSEGRRVAILKPVDEEPLAPNNPKARVLGF